MLVPSAISQLFRGFVSYETENNVYGKSQRLKPSDITVVEQIDIESLRKQFDRHNSVYKSEYQPPKVPTHNMKEHVFQDKNEDHIGNIDMRYPYDTSNRTAFIDWTTAVGFISKPHALPRSSSGCPFGVLSHMKSQGETQYTQDFGETYLPSFSRSRSRTRDTFQYCQGGVPHVPRERRHARRRA